MNTNDATRATAKPLPNISDIDDAVTNLIRAKELNNLMGMAGEGLLSRMPSEAKALIVGSNTINELLVEVNDMLEAVMEGGAA